MSFHDVPDESLRKEIGEEGTLMTVISERLQAMDFFHDEDVSVLSYRLAQILITCNMLQADILPRFSAPLPREQEEALDGLMEIRINLQYLRDLIGEFDEAFVKYMKDEETGDEEQGADGNT